MKTIIKIMLMIFAATNSFAQPSSCADDFKQSSDTSQVGQMVTFTCLHSAINCGTTCVGGEAWWEWVFCQNPADCSPQISNNHGPITVTYFTPGTYYTSFVTGFHIGSNCNLICYCSDYASHPHQVVASPTGINEFYNSASFQIVNFYPNPAKDFIDCSIVSSANDKVTIDLLDVLGRKVMSNANDIYKGENNLLINISNYPQGVYRLRLISESGKYQAQKQFIVE